MLFPPRFPLVDFPSPPSLDDRLRVVAPAREVEVLPVLVLLPPEMLFRVLLLEVAEREPELDERLDCVPSSSADDDLEDMDLLPDPAEPVADRDFDVPARFAGLLVVDLVVAIFLNTWLSCE